MKNQQILSLVIGLIFIAISVYLAQDLVGVSKNLIGRFGIGWVTATIIARALVCLVFARGFQLLVKFIRPTINGYLLFFIGIILGFGLSFLSPIYESDYGDFSSTDMVLDHKGLSELTRHSYQVKPSPYIVAFFTTSCPHCKSASKNLGFMSQFGKLPPVVAIFPGNNNENAEKFLKENNGQLFEYYVLNDESYFVENSGGSFPSIFLIDEKGETVKHWFGDLLNYTAFDYLESIKK